jgi:peptidyl-prolyl cis-trans isomerase SurA
MMMRAPVLNKSILPVTRLAWPAVLMAFGSVMLCAYAQTPELKPATSLAATPATAAGDSIAAVVNQEVITKQDVQRRLRRLEQEAAARGGAVPTRDELQKVALDRLVEEQVQMSWAKESGMSVDDASLDRAIAGVAQNNSLKLPEFIKRVEQEGYPFAVYREQIREEMMIGRLREREVLGRTKVTDAEVEDFLLEQSGMSSGDRNEFNVAQILVALREGANAAQKAQARDKAQQLLQQLRGGADFKQLSTAQSDAPNAKAGGELGYRPLSRLPDAFGAAVKSLKPGEYAEVVESGAGFHVLWLKEKRQSELPTVAVPVTRARHVLLRNDTPENRKQIAQLRQRIVSGSARFEEVAKQYSQDGSAAQGGDLGFAVPGQFVPEFQSVLDGLKQGDVSEPVPTRFGLHLIQVLERKQQQLSQKEMRERAREVLREKKTEENGVTWLADLKAKAFVEIRRD